MCKSVKAIVEKNIVQSIIIIIIIIIININKNSISKISNITAPLLLQICLLEGTRRMCDCCLEGACDVMCVCHVMLISGFPVGPSRPSSGV